MADTSNLTNFLGDIANAIRTKKSTTEEIPAANFDTEILSIETGSISPVGITVTPDDVVYDKKFINMGGTLDSGRLTPSEFIYKDNDIDAKLQTLVRSFDSNISTVFNDLGIYYDGELHILYNLSTTTEVLEQYDFSIDGSDISYVDAGCKDYFGTDTIVIALANSDTLWLYLYDMVGHLLTLKTTETVANYSYPALNPYYNVINISDGVTSKTHTTKMYEISSAFELTELYTTTISNSSTSQVSTIFWYNKDFYRIITETTTDNRYVSGGSSITGSIQRMKSDRTGYVSVSLSSNAGEESNSYFAGASPDSSIVIRSGNNLVSVFTVNYNGTSYSETYTGLYGDCYNYKRVIFLTNTVFVAFGDSFKIAKIYKINDDTLETLATYNANTSFMGPINRYCALVGDSSVYNQLFTATSNSVVDSVIVQNQTFIDPSSGSSGTAEDGNVLEGKTYFSNSDRRTGTMPNNGELVYSPSTSVQTIPAGYTDGGSIGAVTSSIDSYIQSKNIKKDVTILGVTGELVFSSDDATALASEIFANRTAYIAGGKKYGTFSLSEDEVGYGVDEIKKEYIGVPNSFETEIVSKSIMSSFNSNNDEQFYLIDSNPDIHHTFYYLQSEGYDGIGVLDENYVLIQTIQAGKDWGRTSAIGSPWMSLSCTTFNNKYYVGLFSDNSSTNPYSIYCYNEETSQYELTETGTLSVKNKWKFHKYIPGLLCSGSKCYTLTSDGYLIGKSFSGYGTYDLTNRNIELRYATDALAIVRSHVINSTISGQIKYYDGTDFTKVTTYSNLIGLSENHYGAIYVSTTQIKIVKFNSDYTSYDEILTLSSNRTSPFRYVHFITDDIVGVYSLTGNTSYAYKCTTINIDIYKIDYDSLTYEQIYTHTISVDSTSIVNLLGVDNNPDYTMFWLRSGVNTRLVYLEVANKLVSCIDGANNRYYSYDNASTLTDLGNVLEGTGTVIYRNGIGEGTMKNNGELNYTPSEEEQVIPAGYTSGGTIEAVTAESIGLTPDVLKAGITILGITGTYEPDYTELGTISPTEYDTALETAQDILGKEETVNE